MYGVFMAPYISSQSAAICEKAGIGYADLAGNCRLVFGQVYIERRDWPNPSIVKRELRSLFTPKASRILSVLLIDPKRSWKVLDLAREARVSLGQASNVKKLLEAREWVERSTKGLRLSHPEEVLRRGRAPTPSAIAVNRHVEERPLRADMIGELDRIRRLVGPVTKEQLRLVDCFVGTSVALFVPAAGQCGYAISPPTGTPGTPSS